jgi:uncharacterized membrane protein YgcG
MSGKWRRWAGRSGAAVAMAVALLAVTLASAGAREEGDEWIRRYDVLIQIEPDGTLLIEETIDYDFGDEVRHGIYRYVPRRYEYNADFERVTPLKWLEVEGSAGTPDQWKREATDWYDVIRIGDPDTTITGRHIYTIRYRVEGVLNGFAEQDELYWDAVGTDWDVEIERVTVRVEAPGEVLGVACQAGYTNNSGPCRAATKAGPVATFAADFLYPYQGITVVVGMRKGLVAEPVPILDEIWKFEKAFAITPLTVGLGGVVLAGVLVGLGRLFWLRGRDRRFAGGAVEAAFGAEGQAVETVPMFDRTPTPVEFAPPEGLRPGQMGTLLNEEANPVDVTATLIDLATRGYLQIEEIEKKGRFAKPNWLLRKVKEPDAELKEYESLLLEHLLGGKPEVGLESLKSNFAKKLGEVQDALYEDVVAEGWFARRPDKARTKWQLLGLGGMVIAGAVVVAAALLTKLALVTTPLVLGGLLLLLGAGRMPRKTAGGYGIMQRTLGFKRMIETAETRSAEFAEKQDLFTEYLGYAVVFGCTEKWAKAFAGLADAPGGYGTWYVAGSTLHMTSLVGALDSFSSVASSTISAAAASSGGSGFSGGGGSVGGGFGGGGGGSW